MKPSLGKNQSGFFSRMWSNGCVDEVEEDGRGGGTQNGKRHPQAKTRSLEMLATKEQIIMVSCIILLLLLFWLK